MALDVKVNTLRLESFNYPSRIVNLKELKAKKVLINFWASWCTSCIEEVPILNELKQDQNADNYRFISVNVGDNKKKIKKFIKKYKFGYEVLMDPTREVTKSWGIDALPITVILDENQQLIYQGIRPPQTLP